MSANVENGSVGTTPSGGDMVQEQNPAIEADSPRPVIEPGGGGESPPGASQVPDSSSAAPRMPAAPEPTAEELLAGQVEKELAEVLSQTNLEQMVEASVAAAQAPRAPAPSAAEAAVPGTRRATDLIRGRIVAIRGEDVFVDLVGLGSSKMQGVVPLAQFERAPRLGSIMDFVIVRVDEAEGLVHLSREGAIGRATWEQLQKGAAVEARVVAYNKGGLELEMPGGIRAFMPASQIDLHHVEDLSQFVGQKLPGIVQEIDRRSRRVILSRRQYLELERQKQQEKLLAELEVGQIRSGVVRSLTEYGAFVDLGGVDGLVHISDMSYSRISKPSEVVSVGQEVKVKVLKVDREKKRVSLGLKQVTPDPWDGIETRLKVGELVSGRVLRLADFGAFVEVFPGVEGLLPASEVSWRRNEKLTDVVREGDVLRLAVLSLEPAKRRLTLSLKQAGGNPWANVEQKYPKGAIVEATVLATAEFGAFMELEPGVEGLVHISELSDKRVQAVTDVVKVGQKYPVRVLEVDAANRRIRLSLKAAQPKPAEEPSPAAAETQAVSPAQPPKPQKAVKKPPKPLKSGLGESAALGLGLRDLRL